MYISVENPAPTRSFPFSQSFPLLIEMGVVDHGLAERPSRRPRLKGDTSGKHDSSDIKWIIKQLEPREKMHRLSVVIETFVFVDPSRIPVRTGSADHLGRGCEYDNVKPGICSK